MTVRDSVLILVLMLAQELLAGWLAGWRLVIDG